MSSQIPAADGQKLRLSLDSWAVVVSLLLVVLVRFGLVRNVPW